MNFLVQNTKSRNHLSVIAAALTVASLTFGCSDDDSENPPPVDMGVDMGEQDMGVDMGEQDMGADAGDTGSPGDDMGVADTGTPDMGDDAGVNCPTPNALASAGENEVVIEAFDFTNSLIRLKNISSASVDLSGWALCLGPQTYNFDILNGVSIPAGETVDVTGYNLSISALSIYQDNGFTNPNSIRAFVRWGTSDATAATARQDIAVGGNIWTDGDFLPTTTGNGFVAVGDVSQAANWVEVPSSCISPTP